MSVYHGHPFTFPTENNSKSQSTAKLLLLHQQWPSRAPASDRFEAEMQKQR
jgi:hypothetical protein